MLLELKRKHAELTGETVVPDKKKKQKKQQPASDKPNNQPSNQLDDQKGKKQTMYFM